MEPSMSRTAICAFALVTAFLSIGAGHAAPATVVSYGDLDLSRPAGAEALVRRLETASRQVCGGAPDIRNLEAMQRFRACVQVAMDEAVNKVGAPLVREVYAHAATGERMAQR
jgi:UrcA family protein